MEVSIFVVVESSVDEVSSVTSDVAAFVRLSTSVVCLVDAVDEPLEVVGAIDGVETVLGLHSMLNMSESWPTNVFISINKQIKYHSYLV